MPQKLDRSFYAQPSLAVSKQLLGKYIVRKIGERKLVGKIVEVEAYPHDRDKASHTFNGRRTVRTEAEFLIGGHIYIYLVYGMYWQLNISTGPAGKPECVLIRALEPISLITHANKRESLANIRESKIRLNSRERHHMVANGPGKLCNWLKLDKSFYAEDLTKSKRIWLTAGEKIKPSQIKSGPRINIDYAGPYWSKKKWRFWINPAPFLDRKLRALPSQKKMRGKR